MGPIRELDEKIQIPSSNFQETLANLPKTDRMN
jgi:hypothetical protein